VTNKGKTRILIADDHYLVRVGLVALIHTKDDMQVVAEASDGAQAIALYESHRPDLVLMDTRMPIKDGIEAMVEIRKAHPQARIVMLTAFDGDVDICRAVEAGARGYVLKRSTSEILIPAIRAVAKGELWMPKEITTKLDAKKSFESLTLREVEVLKQLAKGLGDKQIAEVLAITEYTARDHLKSIRAKLRVADRTEAVTVALQRGIIHL
jgi:DNA-binding NarL/FixJ family response regulator